MAEPEQFTPEQAQSLLEEVYNNKTPTNATPVTPEAPAAPEVETPAVPETPEPAKLPVETEPAAPAAEPEKKPEPQAPADPYAWVNDIPETLREKVLQEINQRVAVEHRNRSDSGRIRALNNKLLELERERTAKPAEQPAAPPAPKTPEQWAKLAKDDPEIAEAIEARVKSEIDATREQLLSEVKELKKTEQDRLARESQQYVEQEAEMLRRIVPNYEEVIAHPAYSQWLQYEAEPGIREIALKSHDHRDAVRVLKLYADTMQARFGNPTNTPATPTPSTQPAQPDPAKQQADQIEAERRAKLNAPPAAPAKTPVAPASFDPKGPVTKDDQERIFLEYYNKLNKKT
jgi:hypothetical protein